MKRKERQTEYRITTLRQHLSKMTQLPVVGVSTFSQSKKKKKTVTHKVRSKGGWLWSLSDDSFMRRNMYFSRTDWNRGEWEKQRDPLTNTAPHYTDHKKTLTGLYVLCAAFLWTCRALGLGSRGENDGLWCIINFCGNGGTSVGKTSLTSGAVQIVWYLHIKVTCKWFVVRNLALKAKWGPSRPR